ncbi:MAG: cyclic nucleotide-binding domain-containing protein [Desulfomonile tiedjei]|nr:cyclic nucleotide-binding domain-containing protein [Desulfomonile tiedjei]
MASGNNSRAVAPTLVLDFFRRILPFSELSAATLADLAKQCVIAHYPKGSIILRQDLTEVTHLHIIQKGGVKEYIASDDTMVSLKDFSGEGGSFGALPIFSGKRADFNVEAVEDTFCFLIKKEAFLEVVRNNPRFGKYYLEAFSEDTVGAVYSELREATVRSRGEDAFYLFNLRVRDVINTLPETVSGRETVQQVGLRMAHLRVDWLLVKDETGSVVGTVADRDLRTKVVAEGLDYDTPVVEIMTPSFRTIPAQATCFDALLRMMREQVDHLVVEHRKAIVGVISAHDIIVYQGAAFLYPIRDIESQRRISGLYAVSQRLPMVVRTLLTEGARANNVTKVITLFNDNLLSRLLRLLTDEIGPAPVSFCWLNLGSEGRKEQTFKTDQDNALVYEDPQNGIDPYDVEEYFRTFADKAVEHLQACGYPRCKQKFMASNPRWRQSYSVWKGYFEEWLLHPIPPEVGLARIFFDLRPCHGNAALGESLREYITVHARGNDRFLRYLAGDCLLASPPLSFMGDFIVEKDGKKSEGLDLKVRGLSPFVNFARVMALRYGISETETLARLKGLTEDGHLSQALYADAREAYEFQVQLTLVHQLKMLEAGLDPDCFIRPVVLSDLERKTLKETFAVIDRLLEQVQETFGLSSNALS